jgi:hypothetical protein
MPTVRVNWQQLKGRQLETTTGAYFAVVRVTATHVTIRPQRGSRNYALSIPSELERGVAVYAGAPVFPTPAAMRLIGVRPILTSYAWGVLKAVLVDGIGLQVIQKVALKDFAGLWHITEIPDMDEAYLKEGLGPPSMQIHAPVSKHLWGQYQIGLSAGSLQGHLREFGGEQVVIFGYTGMDEMDPVNGGGWMRVLDADTVEGEFMDNVGRFTARRKKAKSKLRQRSQR